MLRKNEHLKKTLEMQIMRLMQLEDEVKECKRSLADLNALKERMSKVEHDHVLKEEKFDTMSRDVSEMNNVCTTKSWADVCNSNVLPDFPTMQVMAQTKNVENVDLEELKERERHLKNIVIRGITEEKLENPLLLPFLSKISLKHILACQELWSMGLIEWTSKELFAQEKGQLNALCRMTPRGRLSLKIVGSI